MWCVCKRARFQQAWLANNQSIATDQARCRPLRYPYADDEQFIVSLANIFTDWMDDAQNDEDDEDDEERQFVDDLDDPSNGITGNGCVLTFSFFRLLVVLFW